MITNEQIKKIISDCASSGYTIKGKDIAYVVLCRTFQDSAFCYASAFGISNNPDAVTLYDQSSPVTFLKKYMDINHPSGVSTTTKRRRKSDVEDISFEENKAEIIKLIKDTQKALEDGTIEPKDALKIQADLRVKLNDKFQVSDDTREQLVQVSPKYDHICPYCNHEVSRAPMSKEDAMKEYNLIER